METKRDNILRKLDKTSDDKELRKKLKSIERKLILSNTTSPKTPRNPPKQRENSSDRPYKKQRQPCKRNLIKKLNMSASEVDLLRQELQAETEKCKQLQTEIRSLKYKLQTSELNAKKLATENKKLQTESSITKSQTFTYDNLKKKPSKFQYLCGLTVEKFDILLNCLMPYSHVIQYPDCKGNGSRSLEKPTELLAVLTICRHGLYNGVMAYMLNVSESTMQRIFVAWIVFMETIFSRINLRPDKNFLAHTMPEIFIKTGHGLTDMVIDCTEFKLQQPSNYDLSTLTFSNYKNTHTGKALLGISPNGIGLVFSEIYPGSISDSNITEKSEVINWVNEDHEIMSDKGFAIQDLCSIKGIYLNRPSQKNNPQFSEAEIANNFDIAATRIHVERFIGRVRDWNILNNVWPIQKIDLLTSTWRSLCYMVNLLFPPIGPKPEGT